jgi:PAS domain S-box-containing protein
MKIQSSLFPQIVENSLDGIWIVDANFQTSYVNKIMADMIGHDASDLMKMKMADLLTPEDWDGLNSKLASRSEGVSEHHTVRFLKKDGSALWVRAACSPLYNDNGEYIGAVGLISDITPFQKDELILQAQRSVFQRLVAGASLEDSLCEILIPIDKLVHNVFSSILLLDDQGRLWKGASRNLPKAYSEAIDGSLIGPNHGACGTSAWLKELIITEDIHNDPRWKDYKHPAEAHGLKACWSSPIISKNGLVLGTFAMYFPDKRKPTEFEIQIVRDITSAAALCIEHIRLMEKEKKHVQDMELLADARRLLASTMEYDEVLRQVPDLILKHGMAAWSFICLRNDDGVYRTISVASVPAVKKIIPHDVIEFDLSASIGLSKAIKTNTAFFEHLNREQLNQQLLLEGDIPKRMTLQTLIALDLQSYIAIPLEVRGEVIGGFLLATNEPRRLYTKLELEIMTEVGRACAVAIDNALLYRELKRSVKAREDFISIASHELRTPLTSLKMRVDLLGLLMERKKFPAEVADILKPIISELRPDVVKFTRLVEILLDFSKLGSNKLHLSIESCDLSKIILEEVERIRPEFVAHKTDLIVSVQDKILGECDQVRVQQVVTNLLTNAVKFGNQKAVSLTVTGDKNAISITVRDQGIGMTDEDSERIFKPFERAVSDKHYGGLGLGLFITKQIVDRHNGTISVKSKVGEGTTFFVSFPLHGKG